MSRSCCFFPLFGFQTETPEHAEDKEYSADHHDQKDQQNNQNNQMHGLEQSLRHSRPPVVKPPQGMLASIARTGHYYGAEVFFPAHTADSPRTLPKVIVTAEIWRSAIPHFLAKHLASVINPMASTEI
jgi:hypothetical protein